MQAWLLGKQATAQSKPAAGGGEAKKEEKKAKRKPARFELRSVQDSGSLLSQGAFHLVLVNAENLPNGLCLRARTGRGGGRGGGDGLRPLRLSVSGQQQGSLWPHPLEHGGAHKIGRSKAAMLRALFPGCPGSRSESASGACGKIGHSASPASLSASSRNA